MEGSKIKFGVWEAVAVLITPLIIQIFLGFPRAMIEVGGTAGWMIPVYVSVIALFLFILIVRLYKPFEGKDLVDIADYVGGNALRIIIGTIFYGYILIIISIVLREYAEDMKVVALTVSPISYVSLFFITGMIVGVYLGIEAVSRFSALLIPAVVAGFLIITLGISGYYNFENILPVFGNGISDIFGMGFLKLSIYSGLSVLFFMAPFLRTHKNFKTVGYVSIGIAAPLLTWAALSYILVFAYPIGLERFLPVYQLARLISLGRFFQRIESIFVLVWATSALLYLSIGCFFVLHIFRKTFRLEYYKPLIMPFAILIFTISLLPPDLMTAVAWENKYVRSFLWVITFVIPILLLAAANFKRKRRLRDA